MRRPATQFPCPTKRQLDQGLPACGFTEKRTENDVRKDDIHDHIHEPPQHARGCVHQRIMNVRNAVEERSRLSPQFGHQIFVDVFWPVEVPNQHGANGVKRDADGYGDQRKSPDFDVVSQEHQDRHAHDGNQPYASRTDAFWILNRVWDRQAHHFGQFNLTLQGFRHDPRAFA